MSTRSVVGGLTDNGTYVVYVHNDGYPDGRLPELEKIIQRDGAAKALATILSARSGGWSYLSASPRESTLPHGSMVEGYGVQYTDSPEDPPTRFPEDWKEDSWCEYAYLIPEVGPIRYAAIQRDVKPEEWDWKEHAVPVVP